MDAFVRNPARLMLRDPELELIIGDVARFDDIRRAVRLSRAVTVAATGLAVLIAVLSPPLRRGGRRSRSARQ